ncbi:MAG: ribonuclease H-like domain-containing protein, partial [Candidatus Cloacimonetes bacterium]|nr:ribonuclease H-like domain-containing protein [Candidatus Cloacimonadota bacterium]
MEIRLLFDEYDLIISYNGKSYDMNLLQSRYDYHGINYRIKDKHQLDLLHLVRRFWKGKLSDCSLQTIEREILHYVRVVEDEIPGWKIPWAYFNYLETGNPDDIIKIHEHNAVDILSMPVVMDYLCRIMANPDETEEHLLPCSKYYEHAGMRDKAVGLLESYTLHETDDKESLRLANLYKRNNDYPSAVAIWSKLAMLNDLTALEELAKYEEHRNRNIELAMQYTTQALDYLHSLPFNDLLPLRNWQRRKNRLESKLAKP